MLHMLSALSWQLWSRMWKYQFIISTSIVFFYKNFKSNLHFFLYFFWRLPLPWILWNAVNWEKDGLGVSSKGAACSISMLFIMLILVFLSILAFKWKMTKAMGAVMLVLYVIFVVISLGFSFGWYTCPNIGGG